MNGSWSLALLLACLPASGPRLVQDPPSQEDAPQPLDFEARLARNPCFRKLAWTKDATFAPFEIYVQKQAVPEPGFEQQVAQFYGPWLARMANVFEDGVATPAQLPPIAEPKPIRLVVLLSEGDYLNYSKTVHTWDGFG